MKIALLGTGRAGGKVFDVVKKPDVVIGFDGKNPPTPEKLQECDVAISFLPGPAFVSYIDLLVEAKIPAAIGSTGFEWPSDMDARLKQAGVAWIKASNFALGMNLIKATIETLAKAPQLFNEYSFKIDEIHHIHKKDSPSGTALSWQEWLGYKAKISAKREGDNPGFHRLKLTTPFEDITLSHQSKDRRIFAEGALWAAKKLHAKSLEPGLYEFQDIVAKELKF